MLKRLGVELWRLTGYTIAVVRLIALTFAGWKAWLWPAEVLPEIKSFDERHSYCSNVMDDFFGFDFSYACFVHDRFYRRVLTYFGNHLDKFVGDWRLFILMLREVNRQVRKKNS